MVTDTCLGLPVVGRLQTPACSGGDTGCDDASFKRRSAELWVVLERSLSRLTSHQYSRYSSRVSCAEQDGRPLTSVALGFVSERPCVPHGPSFPLIPGFQRKSRVLRKSVCLRRHFRLQTLFIAAPYPNTLIMHTCMISRLWDCLLYTSPSPRDPVSSRMPSSA